jgi:hypothetical protein
MIASMSSLRFILERLLYRRPARLQSEDNPSAQSRAGEIFFAPKNAVIDGVDVFGKFWMTQRCVI